MWDYVKRPNLKVGNYKNDKWINLQYGKKPA